MEPTGASSTRFGVSLEGDSSTVAGVFAKTPNCNVDHTLLTSIVDQRGVLRVHYLGVRFDPEEFRRDLLNLLQE
jgi:cytochrome oxidase Cu insertion factor (SCO1/SenC/PrrC family)